MCICIETVTRLDCCPPRPSERTFDYPVDVVLKIGQGRVMLRRDYIPLRFPNMIYEYDLGTHSILDDVFPPDDSSWLPFRSALCKYVYIYIYIPYMSSVIGRMYIKRECHSVLAKLHHISFYRSRSVFLGRARFLCWMPLFVFFGLPIVSCSFIEVEY